MVKDSRQPKRAIYGGLLIAGLVGAALLVFFLDDLVKAFERNYSVVAVVPDAPGIAPGTPVWVGGRAVGEVLTVAILPTSVDTLGRVVVTLELPRRVRDQVRRDSRVRLTSVSLMSEAVVDIVPGSPAAPALTAGDTLRLDVRPSAERLATRAAALRTELDTVMSAVRSLAPVAAARGEQTARILATLDGAAVEVRRLREDMAGNGGLAALDDPAFRASLERARAHVAALPGLVEAARGRAGRAGEARDSLARFRVRVDSLAAQLDAVAASLEAEQGFLVRARQDTALAAAVNAARISLDSLMAEVSRNPVRFVF